jgi:hypothetical protein
VISCRDWGKAKNSARTDLQDMIRTLDLLDTKLEISFEVSKVMAAQTIVLWAETLYSLQGGYPHSAETCCLLQG